MEQSADFQKRTCDYCFGNLASFLTTRQPMDYPADFDGLEYPLFVTWQKNGMLRGCIGTFAFSKLGATLQEYSLVAAVKDSRFQPMTEQDLDENLKCEVSLLHTFEPIEDPLGWEVGPHGIEIEFQGPAGSPLAEKVFRGTYLPNVAPEQGWTQVQALESLLLKAGYQQGFDSVKDRFIKIRRYQSVKYGMGYAEYL